MMFDNILKPLINNFKQNPNNIAFCIDEHFYTYHDLELEILKIRSNLVDIKNRKLPFGLVVNDDLTTYASILALWMEGCSYVPLHPKQPIQRNKEIVEQAQCEYILNSKEDNFIFDQTLILTNKLIQKQFDETICEFNESDFVYILFTSGSTGKPKGVPISRKNLTAFVKSFLEVGFKLTSEDRFLQSFDLTFDVSIQCFVIPLIFGASVYTIPHHVIKYSYVYGLLEEHKLTFATMPPSMINYLKPYFDEIDLQDLKYNIVTAEASTCNLIDSWSNCIPNAEIYNFYGPTEATIYCTYYKYEKNKPNAQINGVLSIGKPMPGITAIIMDENSHIITDSTKGEMYISGAQLTSGYLRDSEKNKDSFIALNYNGEKHVFYKTGDICYFENDTLLYLGRVDHQVKIQGYRIELSEIEYHARQILENKNTIATVFQNENLTNEIALFIEGEDINEEFLKNELKNTLPNYMIPSRIIKEKEFPLNSNGKIDRKSLSLKLNQNKC